VPHIVIGVKIGKETQPDGCTDLNQSERLRQPGEYRQKRCATRRFVRLGRVGQHRRPDGVRIGEKSFQEFRPTAQQPAHVADRRQEKIGLPFAGR
jgi:hypothetical protein